MDGDPGGDSLAGRYRRCGLSYHPPLHCRTRPLQYHRRLRTGPDQPLCNYRRRAAGNIRLVGLFHSILARTAYDLRQSNDVAALRRTGHYYGRFFCVAHLRPGGADRCVLPILSSVSSDNDDTVDHLCGFAVQAVDDGSIIFSFRSIYSKHIVLESNPNK